MKQENYLLFPIKIIVRGPLFVNVFISLYKMFQDMMKKNVVVFQPN